MAILLVIRLVSCDGKGMPSSSFVMGYFGTISSFVYYRLSVGCQLLCHCYFIYYWIRHYPNILHCIFVCRFACRLSVDTSVTHPVNCWCYYILNRHDYNSLASFSGPLKCSLNHSLACPVYCPVSLLIYLSLRYMPIGYNLFYLSLILSRSHICLHIHLRSILCSASIPATVLLYLYKAVAEVVCVAAWCAAQVCITVHQLWQYWIDLEVNYNFITIYRYIKHCNKIRLVLFEKIQ